MKSNHRIYLVTIGASDHLALADLQKIGTAALSELWGRVLAHHDGRAGVPGSGITRLVPVGPNV